MDRVQTLFLGFEGFVHRQRVKFGVLMETRDAMLEDLRDGHRLRDGLAHARERDATAVRILRVTDGGEGGVSVEPWVWADSVVVV